MLKKGERGVWIKEQWARWGGGGGVSGTFSTKGCGTEWLFYIFVAPSRSHDFINLCGNNHWSVHFVQVTYTDELEQKNIFNYDEMWSICSFHPLVLILGDIKIGDTEVL